MITRAWFAVSVGGSREPKDDPGSWLNGIVVDAQEIVEGDVWSITLEYAPTVTRPRSTEQLYVVEATCEVVGRPALVGSAREDQGRQLSFPVRADWSGYIARRVAGEPSAGPLLSHLKWACQEDYDKGMSRLWLKKVSTEGALGDAKRTVAERYVLACVVGNG